MKSEGISVRPLRQITGEAEFNEVFFTDVRVPVENLVGELHGGWQVLMTALMNERTNLGGGMFVAMVRLLEKVVESARERGIADDPRVRQKIAQNWIELEVFKNVSACALSRVSQGRPGPESAILKMFWSEADQRLAKTAMEVLGPYGQLTGGGTAPFAHHYLRVRGRTIEAGTSEVMRNTIATRVLGLQKSF
jgi:alkylation response protein AidB-like acyl-CoA dehydrogenase